MRMSKGVRLDVYLVRVVLPPTEVGGPAIRKQRDKKGFYDFRLRNYST